ncbi:ASCH domain-containing protein [Anaerosalibacter bizertensis]|uniref:ASCH domain-containing protein n=1 Tax=Anaerosalibacter bizertensis TaxID=932217 RepID=A0A9Q4AD11_9FIRM|nr:ASCH domain-containing protein [Anaerosalibacter bizertensis]MBV1821230.1 ASCH domain-containing protein [Bacteroidales bacterium MSK.15.36]MCG4565467.1 ASCH domain-containing protein [Anaerosalibacter bizertensis]MCG4583300.1 ASCH domain-containing protein [Anaerosalibacter bizertensis]HHV26332.1 ASCH domain-containing protein [Tissierellia bacterium]
MKVLLSIKPEYVQKIFEGEKKYEYRKRIFKRTDVESVIVYATKPVGKVIGEFEIAEILEGDPITIWEKTKKYSGIDKKSYIEYFKDNKKGFALSIKNTTIYQEPLDLYEVDPKIKIAPQSFMYI